MHIELETPNWLQLLGIDEKSYAPLGIPLPYWVPVLMSVAVALTICGVVWLGTRRLERVPRRGQAFCEGIVDGLAHFFRGVLGDAAPRYVPLLGSLFLYILVMNWWAQIPGMHAATSKYSTTAGLAVCVFLITQLEGMRHAGVRGYLYHLTGGHDLEGMAWFIQLPLRALFLPLHVIGELVRPLSLSLRLFGNIMGEDTVIAVLVSISVAIFNSSHLPIPLHFPMVFLGLLAGLIQALVFTLLSAIYIGGAAGAFEDHGHDRHGPEAAHHSG